MHCCHSASEPAPAKACVYVGTREHFNFLRNNSCGMNDAMTWSTVCSRCGRCVKCTGDGLLEEKNSEEQRVLSEQKKESKREERGRSVSFNEGKKKAGVNSQSIKKLDSSPKKQRAQSVGKPIANKSISAKSTFASSVRLEKTAEQLEQIRQKQIQNREKVQTYVKQLIPFTRLLSNTRFQEYYNRSAVETYGRANTTQPIGGIIYGNHLKTFNINPHANGNNPQTYQTHHTAINFAKRSKISSEERWKKLQRQLTKKLGLDAKNQSLKEGKNVVYVDVDDDDMYSVMKENHQFQKNHQEEIRAAQNAYKNQKELQRKDKIRQFYEDKKNKISANLSTTNNTVTHDRQDSQRVSEQVVYRHLGGPSARYGTDRHALTCFVDLNFPENDSLYTAELMARNPIFPEKVRPKDKDIDQRRKFNFEHEQRDGIYPKHYLVRACEEPEIRSMLVKKCDDLNKNKSGISGKSTKS